MIPENKPRKIFDFAGLAESQDMKIPAKVWCYSGHLYAERPDSFLWEGEVQRVEEVKKVWLEPGERHFLIRSGRGLFELCYHELADEWSVTKKR